MSGLAHKRSNCRTFLVRQWGNMCVDGAATLMLPYELDASHEVEGGRYAEDFRSMLLRPSRGGGGLCEANACPTIHRVPHVINNPFS